MSSVSVMKVLTPCPWCQRSPRLIQQDDFFTYQCSGLPAGEHLALANGETEQEAFDNWNRAAPKPIQTGWKCPACEEVVLAGGKCSCDAPKEQP
jgi:hypothetical protein